MEKRLFLSALSLALCAGMTAAPRPAAAQEMGTLAYYALNDQDYRAHYNEWRQFLEYQLHREQCQHYVPPPEGYVMKGCHLYRKETEVAQIEPRAGEATPTPPPSSVVYFNWDRSSIRPDQRMTLDQAIAGIKQANPSQVVVSGHADRSGPDAYNDRLSQRRADTVSNDMVAHGIARDTIEEHAYGEKYPAVPTADGVREQANRRVVIEWKAP